MKFGRNEAELEFSGENFEKEFSWRAKGFRVLTERLVPFLIFGYLTYPSVVKLFDAFRDGVPLLTLINRSLTALFVLLILILFLFRHDTRQRRSSLLGKIVAVAGTFGAALFALNANTVPRPALEGIAIIVQIIGLGWSILSLAYLGRSFGIFPDVRGLVRNGPYRFVRHPLYLGEILLFLGALLPVWSLMALMMWLIASGLQVWRSIHEERALKEAFPEEYAEYVAQTDRLIPGVW